MADLRALLTAEVMASPTPALSVAAEADGRRFEFVVGDIADSSVRFQAASITKVVTAEVVLSLVEDGLLVRSDGEVLARLGEYAAVFPFIDGISEIPPRDARPRVIAGRWPSAQAAQINRTARSSARPT